MIVTALYYESTYFGSPLETATFNKWNLRAEDDIYALGQFVYDDLTADQQEYVKKAICAQIEYYVMNGETYNNSDSASESIGRFSRSGVAANKAGAFAPRALQYLEMAGVMNRSVDRVDYTYHGSIL